MSLFVVREQPLANLISAIGKSKILGVILEKALATAMESGRITSKRMNPKISVFPYSHTPFPHFIHTHRQARTLSLFVPLNPTVNGEDGESGVLLHKGEVGSRQLTQKHLPLLPSFVLRHPCRHVAVCSAHPRNFETRKRSRRMTESILMTEYKSWKHANSRHGLKQTRVCLVTRRRRRISGPLKTPLKIFPRAKCRSLFLCRARKAPKRRKTDGALWDLALRQQQRMRKGGREREGGGERRGRGI